MPHLSPIIKPLPGTPLQWGHPLSYGLVGCWLMNEGSGSVVTNLAKGIIENGDLGTVNWVPGGLFFDETVPVGGSKVNFGRPNIAGWENVSIFIKFKWVETAQADEYALISNYTNATTSGILIRIEPATDTFELFTVCEANQLRNVNLTDLPLTSGKVHTVAFVLDGSSLKGYVDGVLSTQTTSGGIIDSTATARDLEFGQSPHVPGVDNYNGDIYTVYFWKDHALTPTEISSLHAASFPMFVDYDYIAMLQAAQAVAAAGGVGVATPIISPHGIHSPIFGGQVITGYDIGANDEYGLSKSSIYR
jgi:hypothetical protein